MNKILVNIISPVHNEGESIRKTLIEFYDAYKDSNFEINFIISEDGSTDNSLSEIDYVKKIHNLNIISDPIRKGYSKAVIDGLQKVEHNVVSFIDSDGQCDPADFERLYKEFNGNNLVIGYRNPRNDSNFRKFISYLFKIFYVNIFKIKLIDPSCPYFVTSKKNVNKILATKEIGILEQGFWWEFYARAIYLGIEIVEVPINHRTRSGGKTVVYRLNKLPKIAISHLKNLFKLKKIIENNPN
jgi:glycosyltransferase involved in cell wall biosynthesis